jgi:hypothetical protein
LAVPFEGFRMLSSAAVERPALRLVDISTHITAVGATFSLGGP